VSFAAGSVHLTTASSFGWLETEILRLANAGLTNADISHRLFISTRTVESHVSSMLQKTGLTTREQLPSASAAEN
jgi:DNA-binding NarL/FixJ family response regulator